MWSVITAPMPLLRRALSGRMWSGCCGWLISMSTSAGRLRSGCALPSAVLARTGAIPSPMAGGRASKARPARRLLVADQAKGDHIGEGAVLALQAVRLVLAVVLENATVREVMPEHGHGIRSALFQVHAAECVGPAEP